MQRLLLFGCALNVAGDLAALYSESSGSVLTGSLLIGAVPAAIGLCQLLRTATGNEDEIAEYHVETIHR